MAIPIAIRIGRNGLAGRRLNFQQLQNVHLLEPIRVHRAIEFCIATAVLEIVLPL